MWGFGGRCYWGRKGRGGKKVEGIVVIFAWMSSEERHVKSYIDLYASLGWNSLVCHSQFLNMFFPEKGTSLALEILYELSEELKVRPCPVVFASFSGGPKACMCKVLQIIEGKCAEHVSLDEYRLVRDCISGQIFDSTPVDFTSDLGSRFVLHPTVLKRSRPPLIASWIAHGLAYSADTFFLRGMESLRAEYWQTLYSTISMGAPYLILCSENDDLAPVQTICNFAQRLKDLGGDVKLVKWSSSSHVGHYRNYPIDYKAAVTELLGKAAVIYSRRIRLLEGEKMGFEGTQDEVSESLGNLGSNQTFQKRVALDLNDHFFVPSSVEYHGDRGVGSMQDEHKERYIPMSKPPSINAHGILGQVLFDVFARKDTAYMIMAGLDQSLPEQREKVGSMTAASLLAQLFDGHNGSAAAIDTKENLLINVLGAIPPDLNRDEWVAALPRALIAGFVKTDKDLQENVQTSGTTVTFVIIEGWVVTVASVGDSRCILESAKGGIYYLSADHRLECNEEERERITASGGEVGRLNTGGGTQVGPLRCWPGGLCLSRSIGDTDVGKFIVSVPPYVKQVKLSSCGGRVVISSDGVWDALSAETALASSRGMPPDAAASQIVKEAVGFKGLRDDTTCIVVDLQPLEKTNPPPSPPPKKQGIAAFKSMFKKKSSESSSNIEKECSEPDVVEELVEEGSAMLSERLDTKYPIYNMFKLFMCAVCQLEMKPEEDVSIHAGPSITKKLRPWDGPFLCTSCQEKKEAMEGRRHSGDSRCSESE